MSNPFVTDVAVLYCDARGPYPKLVEHWYDETRDARSYTGPWPVVAHPPCGPWGPLRHLNQKQNPADGLHAVEQVRRWGGVLEQPAGSKLWEAARLPIPGALPRSDREFSLAVNQVEWGHVARKPTWLYFFGVPFSILPSSSPFPDRKPTHWCSGFRTSTGRSPKHYRKNGSAVPPGIKVASAQQRRRTPEAFARWLVSLARAAEVRHAA